MKKRFQRLGFTISVSLAITIEILALGVKNSTAEGIGFDFLKMSNANIFVHDTAKKETAGKTVLRTRPHVKGMGRNNMQALAATPPMGWNSWNWFGKDQINEKIVREVIDAMVKNGLRDAGYKYVVVDGGWRDTVLGPNGELRADPQKFPHGIKALADYAHSKGLKFGLHTVPGTWDCGGDKVGGYGHEKVQIQQFVNWGIDFIKLDKCRMKGGWDEPLLKSTYVKWSKLLKNCGRNIVLSISAYKFRDWNPEVGQMSRTTGDIGARVNGGARFDSFEIKRRLSVMRIAEINSLSAKRAGHGYWNDPDMLVVGSQGLTWEEQKLHFALWCIMSAPLFLGNDPRHMSPCEKDIILNKDCIRIDQDPTEQGTRIKKEGNKEIWEKKLEDGEVAVLLLNRSPDESGKISFDMNDIGFSGKAKIKDVFAKKKLDTYTKSFSAHIGPQSGLLLLIQ